LLKKKISIWNINSFAEFFLQIIGKYEKQYIDGCNSLINERNQFINELQGINYLRVIPSQANFILCEVMDSFTSLQLTQILYNNFNVLIKDCSGKKGFNEKQFIRIAIRDRQDNSYLVEAFKTLC